MKFKCILFQKRNLFYIYGCTVLVMIVWVSVCYPGSGVF
jgi:hypothetical protein